TEMPSPSTVGGESPASRVKAKAATRSTTMAAAPTIPMRRARRFVMDPSYPAGWARPYRHAMPDDSLAATAPLLRRVYLALGSNLGDREGHLREAVRGLSAGGVAIDVVSSLYETPPWGVEEQPAFLNAAVGGETRLT